jgi:myo-inositol catabolism protein IolS
MKGRSIMVSVNIKKRRIGRTDLEVTEIGLGTNAVGGSNLFDGLNDEDGIAVVRRAFDLGINFFDTADLYGYGRSEELIGIGLGKHKNEVIVASKAGYQWDEKTKVRIGFNNDPLYLRKCLDASLKRLGREWLDLYYIHRPDGKTPLEEAFGALLRFKEEGKIRYAGVSAFTVDQLKKAMAAGPIDVLQSEYNLFNRGVESEILPFCEEHGIGFIPYGPIAFGILSGTMTRDMNLTGGDWRRGVSFFSETNFPRAMDIVDELKKVAAKRGVPFSHLALRWILRKPIIASTITGARHPEEVEQKAGAVGWDLTPDELARIDELTLGLSF